MKRVFLASVFACLLACPAVRADYVETFDNNVNAGGWFYTTNPIRLNQIEPTGGNPGAWFHGTELNGAPTVQTDPAVTSPFTGDYASRDVTRIGVDTKVINGESDRRGLTLVLYDFAGGDIDNSLTAYTSIRPIPNSGSGWRPYLFNVPADDASIPKLWSMFRGDGAPATDADWTRLMSHVDGVQFMFGEFGFAYPLHTVWDLGIDNARITDAGPRALTADAADAALSSSSSLLPEPTSVFALLGLSAAGVRRRRR